MNQTPKMKGKNSIPVQLSEEEFHEFIFPHLPEKMQKRHYDRDRKEPHNPGSVASVKDESNFPKMTEF